MLRKLRGEGWRKNKSSFQNPCLLSGLASASTCDLHLHLPRCCDFCRFPNQYDDYGGDLEAMIKPAAKPAAKASCARQLHGSTLTTALQADQSQAGHSHANPKPSGRLR